MLLKKAERRYGLRTTDYAKLAAFRQELREFLRFSEEAAGKAGLTSQHYQAMLVLRAAADDDAPVTINTLAQHLLIKHNSAVGLVDRLVREGLVTRRPSSKDRRKVELKLSARGRGVLARLAAMHRAELQRVGAALKRVIAQAARR